MHDLVPTPPPRQWYKKKRWVIPLGLIAVSAVHSSGSDDADQATKPLEAVSAAAASPAPVEVEPAAAVPATPEPAAVKAPGPMGDWSGKSVQSAIDAVSAAGGTADAHDMSGKGRTLIVYANWQVCDQSIAAGEPTDGPVSFGAVKFGESCSPAPPTAVAARAVAADGPAEADEAALGTVSQQNAHESARSYLSHSAFSRSGLIEQLEYEGFSTADATYGVDAQHADWSAQAAASAQSYLSHSAFSRSGLIEQLEYEGFTRAEAEYGVAQTGL